MRFLFEFQIFLFYSRSQVITFLFFSLPARLFSFLVFLPLFNDNSGHPPRLIVRAHS